MDQAVLWWVRRDLRLADNQALSAALKSGGRVLPVYILDPVLLRSPWVGEKRLAFLFSALRSMDDELRKRGSCLIVRRGEPAQLLESLLAESGSQAIFAEADVSPYAHQRDSRLARSLPLHLTPGLTIHPPGVVSRADGNPFTVFTPFARAWRAIRFPGKTLPVPDHIPGIEGIVNESLPIGVVHSSTDLFPATEMEAHRRLNIFFHEHVQTYREDRNRMDLEGTSALSPYLRFGLLSARQAAEAALEAEQDAGKSLGAEAWLNEIIWREFYYSILYFFPYVRRRSFRRSMQNIPWRNDLQEFEAWKTGHTGYPIVDAAMRQLHQTGWMHNRARMITASFLVKDLMIDWRWGEKWFMQHLLDGDPASNNGGWQWSAGTGTDAAPYFRVFNPVLQAKKFDPQADYVRRWIPELINVPLEFIHEPWRMSTGQQKRSGCTLGKDYPEPIVEHALARQRALKLFKSVRDSDNIIG